MAASILDHAVRFLHTADWQLGMTRHFLDADAGPRYTAARIDAISAMREVILAQGCQFVVVCGDVFESNLVAPRVVRRSLTAMGELGVPVYLLPGNHDPLDASSIYHSKVFRDNLPDTVSVLTGQAPVVIGDGVELVAAPWFSKVPRADLVAAAVHGLTEPGPIRIVVGHGGVDVLSADPSDRTVIGTTGLRAALDAGLVHYVALGDRHSVTQVLPDLPIWYSGTPQATDYDEVDPGQVLAVEVRPDGSAVVTPHRVGTWTFADLSFDLNSRKDIDELAADLQARKGQERTVLRLSLTGTLSLADKTVLDDRLDTAREVFAAIEVWDKRCDLAVVVDPRELGELGVGGFAAAAVAELIEMAAGRGDQAGIAQNALSLMYRLARGAA